MGGILILIGVTGLVLLALAAALLYLLEWRKRAIQETAIRSRRLTKKFLEFEDYQKKENRRKNFWESQEKMLCVYIITYKQSPFEDDINLQEAKKFLKEQHIIIDFAN